MLITVSLNWLFVSYYSRLYLFCLYFVLQFISTPFFCSHVCVLSPLLKNKSQRLSSCHIFHPVLTVFLCTNNESPVVYLKDSWTLSGFYLLINPAALWSYEYYVPIFWARLRMLPESWRTDWVMIWTRGCNKLMSYCVGIHTSSSIRVIILVRKSADFD